jgi:hypothetical protein
MEACDIASTKSSVNAAPTPTVDDDKNRLFLHLKYHPDDVSCSMMQELYQQHLGDVLLDELGIPRPTIAYTLLKTLGTLYHMPSSSKLPAKKPQQLWGRLEQNWHLSKPPFFLLSVTRKLTLAHNAEEKNVFMCSFFYVDFML